MHNEMTRDDCLDALLGYPLVTAVAGFALLVLAFIIVQVGWALDWISQ
jgi:hypothetical protein